AAPPGCGLASCRDFGLGRWTLGSIASGGSPPSRPNRQFLPPAFRSLRRFRLAGSNQALCAVPHAALIADMTIEPITTRSGRLRACVGWEVPTLPEGWWAQPNLQFQCKQVVLLSSACC